MTTHTFLLELRTLGVQLSTDGVQLTIDAPKGVISIALKQIRTHTPNAGYGESPL